MKQRITHLIISGICLALFSACRQSEKPGVNNSPATTSVILKNAAKTASGSEHLYLKNDSLYIVADKKVYAIAKDTSINYKNPFAAIYQIGKDSITRSYSLVLNNLVYFTTYEDLGQGYRANLYVFDAKTHRLVYNQAFKHYYLYSSAAIFIIDRNNNKIFSIGKPGWYERKQTLVTSASMYSAYGSHFKFYKNIYEGGDKTDRTALMKFYHHSLTNNAKRGLTLPENWWK